MKGSKWQYIRDKCIEMGYTKSAKIAQEIEDALVNIYGDSSTPAWRIRSKEIVDLWPLIEIIKSRPFCKGCVETNEIDAYCFGCKYGKLEGECLDLGSQFHRFQSAYKEEEQCHRENKQNKSK